MKKEWTIKDIPYLLRKKKFVEAVDCYNDEASKYREKGNLDMAIELAEKGSSLARLHELSVEGSFCERQLCEVYALLENRSKSLEHAEQFRKLSEITSHPSQTQLSHHVTAWCYVKLFDHGKVGNLELEKGLEHIEKSDRLIRKYEPILKKYEIHGTVAERKLGLQNLKAQILQLLGNEREAIEVLTEAEECVPSNLPHIKYEIILTKIGLVSPKSRLNLAKKLADCAPKKKKGNAFLEFSHQLIVNNKLKEGYNKLREVYVEHSKDLEQVDKVDINKRLPILYKIIEYQKILKSQSTSLSKCEIYEAIADLYDKYYGTFNEKEKKEYSTFAETNIVANYQKMIENKRDIQDELRALNGIALVFLDIEKFVEAKTHFEKRLDILESNKMDKNDIDDVKVSLLKCDCKIRTAGVTKTFQALKTELTFPNHLKELFDVWSVYCGTIGQVDLENVYRQKSDETEEIVVENEDDESDVMFGKKTNEEILELCSVEYNRELKYGKAMEKKDKTNGSGETKLHEAAKEEDPEFVERLCKSGYDVNAKDKGGWTPLAEAIDSCEIDNVRILLKYGADVNCVSETNLEDRPTKSRRVEDKTTSSRREQTGTHKRITPLMDACCNGYVDIAKLLIERNANMGMRDNVGWTAYNHLENYIKENETNDGQLEFQEYLRQEMKNRNIPLEPIKVRRKSSSPTKLNRDVFDMDVDGESDDDCRILATSSNRIRKRPYSEEYENRPKRVQNLSPNFHPKPPFSSSRPIRRTPPPRKSPIFRSRSPEPLAQISPRVYSNHMITPTRRSLEKNTFEDMIVVILIFDAPEDFDKMKLQFSKSSEIRDIKKKILEDDRKKKFSKTTIYEKTQSGDKFELSDDYKLSMFKENEITLVCKLSPLTALEFYRHTVKDPVNEVCERLEMLSTKNCLNLSHLFLSPKEFGEILTILKNAEVPDEFSLDLSRCDLNTEDELNLRNYSKNVTSLILHATKSTTSLEYLFKEEFPNLKSIEMSSIEVRDQNLVANFISKNKKIEKISMIELFSRCLPSSPIIQQLTKMENLMFLDLSNTKWASDSDWKEILESLKNLKQLNLNDVETMVEFDNQWLPQLTELQVRRSKLNWTTIIEFLSTSQVLKFDIRGSHFDEELNADLEELRKNKIIILR